MLATIASRLGRIIGLLALAFALAGCSAIKLGYNTLDDVGYWWLDSYLDFSDEQASRVRDDLGRLHRWHRESELPKVVALLQAMERAAPGDVTGAQVCAFVDQFQQRLDAVSERVEPPAVTLAVDLAPEQLAHLERKYRKSNEDFRKDWVRLAPAELAEKRFGQFVDRSEMIYGKLDEPQRVVLRGRLQQSMFDPRRALAERQRRQADALQTLRQVARPSITLGEARTLMQGFLGRLRQPPEAAARAYQQAWIEESCGTFAALHNSTTAAQREAAARRLRAYQRDLLELSGQR